MKQKIDVTFIVEEEILTLESLCDLINMSEFRVHDYEGNTKITAEAVFTMAPDNTKTIILNLGKSE